MLLVRPLHIIIVRHGCTLHAKQDWPHPCAQLHGIVKGHQSHALDASVSCPAMHL